MQVFPGGSGNLEALPGVGRAAVQQLRPGDVVLAWDADLPVAIDHKLGAAILEGWKREMESSGGLVLHRNMHHQAQLVHPLSSGCKQQRGFKNVKFGLIFLLVKALCTAHKYINKCILTVQ